MSLWFTYTLTLALFLLFALPGWVMFRDARASVRAA